MSSLSAIVILKPGRWGQTNPENNPKLFETTGLAVVPRAGVEPGRPYGQRILSLKSLVPACMRQF